MTGRFCTALFLSVLFFFFRDGPMGRELTKHKEREREKSLRSQVDWVSLPWLLYSFWVKCKRNNNNDYQECFSYTQQLNGCSREITIRQPVLKHSLPLSPLNANNGISGIKNIIFMKRAFHSTAFWLKSFFFCSRFCFCETFNCLTFKIARRHSLSTIFHHSSTRPSINFEIFHFNWPENWSFFFSSRIQCHKVPHISSSIVIFPSNNFFYFEKLRFLMMPDF